MNWFEQYVRLVQLAIKSRLQYRVDFITGIAGVIVMNVVNISLISILVARFSGLHGWGVWEVVFLYSLWLLGHSLFSTFFWHVQTLEEYLVHGTFDQFLIRPASPFVLFMAREISYLGFADFAIGVGGISLAYSSLGLSWGGGYWLFLVAAVLAGALIELTIALLFACIAFWTGRSRRANTLLLQMSVMVQYYPIDIFDSAFRLLVTSIIPVAFMNYYPALMLLGKLNLVGDWWFLAYLSPVVALVLVALSALVWRKALARYSSAGG